MKILQLKGRSVEKGLINVAADMQQIDALLEGLTPAELEKLRPTWPAPHTWLLPDVDQLVPPWVKGKFATVAVRVSARPLVQAGCREFGGRLDWVLPGRLGGRQGPSIIRDLRSSTMLR